MQQLSPDLGGECLAGSRAGADALCTAGLMFDAVALYQGRRRIEAMLLLRTVLPPTAALAAGEMAEAMATDLARAGCRLAAPTRGAVQIAGLVADAAAAPFA